MPGRSKRSKIAHGLLGGDFKFHSKQQLIDGDNTDADPEDAHPLAGAVLTEDEDAHELADERGMDENSDAEEISTDERAERALLSEKNRLQRLYGDEEASDYEGAVSDEDIDDEGMKACEEALYKITDAGVFLEWKNDARTDVPKRKGRGGDGDSDRNQRRKRAAIRSANAEDAETGKMQTKLDGFFRSREEEGDIDDDEDLTGYPSDTEAQLNLEDKKARLTSSEMATETVMTWEHQAMRALKELTEESIISRNRKEDVKVQKVQSRFDLLRLIAARSYLEAVLLKGKGKMEASQECADSFFIRAKGNGSYKARCIRRWTDDYIHHGKFQECKQGKFPKTFSVLNDVEMQHLLRDVLRAIPVLKRYPLNFQKVLNEGVLSEIRIKHTNAPRTFG